MNDAGAQIARIKRFVEARGSLCGYAEERRRSGESLLIRGYKICVCVDIGLFDSALCLVCVLDEHGKVGYSDLCKGRIQHGRKNPRTYTSLETKSSLSRVLLRVSVGYNNRT